MNINAILSSLKIAAVAALVAAFAAFAAAIGADPVFNSDPFVAGVAGFVLTWLGRGVLAVKDYLNEPVAPEVIPLSATVDAKAVMSQPDSVLRRFAERDVPPSGL